MERAKGKDVKKANKYPSHLEKTWKGKERPLQRHDLPLL